MSASKPCSSRSCSFMGSPQEKWMHRTAPRWAGAVGVRGQADVPFRIRAAMTTKFPGFSHEAIKFLRNLTKNNKREWFQPRKQQYEELIRLPMVQLVEC